MTLQLENSWQSFEYITVTLRQMIDGYLEHIELHLNEIHELIDQLITKRLAWNTEKETSEKSHTASC